MKIVTLTEKEFNLFKENNNYNNIYQSIEYAKFKISSHYDNYLLYGFINNSNQLVAASMILYKKVFLNYKIGYAPFGFLADYSNSYLIEDLTVHLKLKLLKERFIYLKINPNIICSERDSKGNIIKYNPEINDIMEILSKNDYKHYGFNNYFENKMPRWNALLKLNSSNKYLYKDLDKNIRNKINKSEKFGLEFKEASIEERDKFYSFVKYVHNKKYYEKLLECYKDKAKIYLATINTRNYLAISKNNYEKETYLNEELNNKLGKDIKIGKKVDKLLTKKMESDKLVEIYKKRLDQANKLFFKNQEAITIGGLLVIEENDSAYLIVEGYNKKYQDFNSNYFLNWELIKYLNKKGMKNYNMNGIVGEFKNSNKYKGLNESKLGFNSVGVEYIGEFDLIINKTIYNIYKYKKNK